MKLSPKWHYSLCVAGIVIALYSIYVESMLVTMPGYEPSCNISFLSMSCSKVFTSRFARPLSNWGFVRKGTSFDFSLPQLALFYFLPLLAFPAVSKRSRLATRIYRSLSYLAVGFNMYLAYVLKFILVELCVVCVSNYIVNLGLLLTIDNIARHAAERPPAKLTSKKIN